jgi:hypothetical protein
MSEPVPEWEGINNPKHRHMRQRCNGHKKNGEQCQKPAINGATVCRTHGGATRHVRDAARRRLEEAADRMAKQLLGIAESAESEAVKLAAVKDALDRAGLKPPTQVEVGVGLKPWEQLVAGMEPITRAESRARRGVADATPPLPPQRALTASDGAEIVDAEVVDPPGGHGGEMPATGWGNGPGAPPQPPTPPGTGLMTLEDANAALRQRHSG